MNQKLFFSFLKISLCLFSVLRQSKTQDSTGCSINCSPNGYCANINGDSCCKCNEGYMGNGFHCFERDQAIVVRGNVNGNLNDFKIEDQEIHAFVHTLSSDARNYVAIGRIPKEIGSKVTLILPFATPIHWLFAGSNSNTLNGFSLTGGVFSRQSDSTFLNEQGDVVGNLYINQNFTGLYENKELRLDGFIEGKLPDLDDEDQVIFPDFNENYEFKSQAVSNKKLVEARGTINYIVTSKKNPTVQKKFRLEHNERIHFSVCNAILEEELSKKTASVQLLTKRLFASYTQNEGQVKFSSANFLRAMDSQESNPCEKNECSIYAECVVDSEAEGGHYCQCKPGFDGDGKDCEDLNECEEGSAYCSPNAECRNLLGFYECICHPPRVSDGRNCELSSESDSDDACSRCDSNARCVTDDTTSFCQCNSGYTGNGYECRREYFDSDSEQPQPSVPVTIPTRTTTTASTTTRQRLEHSDKCEQCHVYATCELKHETGGECCTCLEGYIGNGKYCYPQDTPLYVSGKLSGTLNNEKFDELDVYGYVLTHSSDSRNFVAIGKIPAALGGSFQILVSLVNPINWLFSGRNGLDPNVKVSNGFEITGGLFSRNLVLNFFDESSRKTSSVTIRQEFLGLDLQAKDLVVRTEIDGTIPYVDADAQVVFKDYKQEYIREGKGLIKSNGELGYEVTSTQNSQSFRSFKIEYFEEITFNECPHLIDHGSSNSRVNSKRVFIRYTKGDSLIRFSSANFIYPKDYADDPCELNTCSIYAECITDNEAPKNYSCVCKVGFEGDGFNCYDVDECETGEAECDPNAVCYNLVGHYECSCRAPFIGSGKECSYELNCNSCDFNAKCVEYDLQKKCVCNPGWVGDGFQCQRDTSNCECGEYAECITSYSNRRQECKCKPGFVGDGFDCTPLPCNEYSNCNENARCVLNSNKNYACNCNAGFFGDGFKCSTQSCEIKNDCGNNARCLLDSLSMQYKCFCDTGFIGNGYQCVKDIKSCDALKNCHLNAECLFDERTNRHVCRCKPGFTGDGFSCSAINSCRDRTAYDICDKNAECVYDTKVNDFICKCKSGYEGNGLRSKCYIDESYGLFLVYAQGASLHKLPFRNVDEENVQPHKNRIVHIPGQTAVGLSYDCHEQYIYWSDVSSNVINRIRADGSNFSIVLQNVKSAEGLAVDWISRNIYFTDSEARTIEVASLNGKFRKVLIKSHLSNPRGIAVDPIDGYIFWTDWNRKSPKIERANMDGTHRKIIVSEGLGIPNGVYFDQKRQEVCWADAKEKKIECVEKDGSNRRLIASLGTKYPFDLTEVRTNIYWSDWSTKQIQNVDKDGLEGKPIKLSIGGNGRVYGIVAAKNSCPRGTNACDRTNGNCNQLCLPRPDHNRQCACSDDSGSECTRSILNQN